MFPRNQIYSAVILALMCPVGVALAQSEPTTEQKLDMLMEEVERLKQQVGGQTSLQDTNGKPQPGHAGPSHIRVAHSSGAGDTKIGGYGEIHYNNLDSKKEMDFHRFVLFFGHSFSDRVRFFSEMELEHTVAGEGKKGEIELEQAFIEFDLSDRHRAQAGLFVLPVGILNQTHEPPTFYGVERNPVETNIIPTTWWEGGAGLNGEIAPGWGYDVTVSSGLFVPTSGTNAYLIRSGRQAVSNARANDLAYTGRIKWTGWSGVELAATAQYQADVTQGTAAAASATLFEAHAVVSQGPFGLRALYANWNVDSDPAKAVGRDTQSGWYIEPSYKILPNVGVFVRYNTWDNQAGDSADSEKQQTNLGVNFWPHEDVVIKADIQQQSGVINDDGFNLGIGYQF